MVSQVWLHGIAFFRARVFPTLSLFVYVDQSIFQTLDTGMGSSIDSSLIHLVSLQWKIILFPHYSIDSCRNVIFVTENSCKFCLCPSFLRRFICLAGVLSYQNTFMNEKEILLPCLVLYALYRSIKPFHRILGRSWAETKSTKANPLLLEQGYFLNSFPLNDIMVVFIPF